MAAPVIIVYAKPGCGICEAAKDKLRRMGLEFETRDLATVLAPHSGWRDDESVDVLAASALLGNPVPIIAIDGRHYDYAGAMKELKRRQEHA